MGSDDLVSRIGPLISSWSFATEAALAMAEANIMQKLPVSPFMSQIKFVEILCLSISVPFRVPSASAPECLRCHTVVRAGPASGGGLALWGTRSLTAPPGA